MSERDLLYCAICGNITPHERRPESNRWICMEHGEEDEQWKEGE